MSFVCLMDGERRTLSPLKWPRGEMRASAESGIRHRIDIANFGGDIKLFLWWRIECI